MSLFLYWTSSVIPAILVPHACPGCLELLSEYIANLPSQFRSNRARDRSGRTQIDHDVFEGLPVRQWRQGESLIGPPPTVQAAPGKQIWPEPPMPRDWHMLPEVSQQLLRAARAGKLYKPPTPPHDGEDKLDEDDGEGTSKATQEGFLIRKWSQIPRHLEPPEREYLAKRRKGLPSVYSTWSGQQGPLAQTGTMRKTKVRRTDAEANMNVWEVLVPEGQTVEGEVLEEAAEAVPASAPAVAPGTVIEGVGVVNADGLVVAGSEIVQPPPPRRKPPPPRRKPKKGPGRGHKKKVAFESGVEGAVEGQNGDVQADGLAVPRIHAEGATPAEGDTPMPDAQEGDEDEESGEEGEEVEEVDDDEDREEGELSETPNDPITPARPVSSTGPTSAPAFDLPPAPPPINEPAERPIVVDAFVEDVPPPPLEVAAAVEQTVDASLPEARLTEAPAFEVAEAVTAPETFLEAPAVSEPKVSRDSSPDEPLASISHSRSGSLTQPNSGPPSALPKDDEVKFADGEVDLFGSLEKHLEQEGEKREPEPAVE